VLRLLESLPKTEGKDKLREEIVALTTSNPEEASTREDRLARRPLYAGKVVLSFSTRAVVSYVGWS
jgi:hypothetical protein